MRLPNSAFKANAGTQVTTDIIFLQKNDPNDPEFESKHPRDEQGRFVRKWADTGTMLGTDGKTGDPAEVRVNEYFMDNPQMLRERVERSFAPWVVAAVLACGKTNRA